MGHSVWIELPDYGPLTFLANHYNMRFGLVFFLFNGISTFVGYLMPKPFSKKENTNGTI